MRLDFLRAATFPARWSGLSASGASSSVRSGAMTRRHRVSPTPPSTRTSSPCSRFVLSHFHFSFGFPLYFVHFFQILIFSFFQFFSFFLLLYFSHFFHSVYIHFFVYFLFLFFFYLVFFFSFFILCLSKFFFLFCINYS